MIFTTVKLSALAEAQKFRWSPGGPEWIRLGAIVRSAEDPAHTIIAPNWDANVFPALTEGN